MIQKLHIMDLYQNNKKQMQKIIQYKYKILVIIKNNYLNKTILIKVQFQKIDLHANWNK